MPKRSLSFMYGLLRCRSKKGVKIKSIETPITAHAKTIPSPMRMLRPIFFVQSEVLLPIISQFAGGKL